MADDDLKVPALEEAEVLLVRAPKYTARTPSPAMEWSARAFARVCGVVSSLLANQYAFKQWVAG